LNEFKVAAVTGETGQDILFIVAFAIKLLNVLNVLLELLIWEY